MDDPIDECRKSLAALIAFCRREAWRGYDPYDGLNSPLARLLPSKLPRTVLTQLVKRSVLNLRPLLGIKKGVNPKAIALVARSAALLHGSSMAQPSVDGSSSVADNIAALALELPALMKTLLELRSKAHSQPCWGYNFDWQSRAFFAPRGTPNAVCTVFAAHAMFDWYEKCASDEGLHAGLGGCDFIFEHLRREDGSNNLWLSYTPLDSTYVHNVNLLCAELLARGSRLGGDTRLREVANRVTEYTLSRQLSDGSWPYGEARDQRWIDSFHTGFILVSLKRLIEYLRRDDWRVALSAGFEFYRDRFFLADGTPRYYHDSLYPIDVHCAAQAVITFTGMTDLMSNAKVLAGREVTWAIRNLQDPAGYFYFQRHRFLTNKIPFMRWAQAWMIYALTLYLTESMETHDV
ncbi:MAG TPA: hypothetical protein VKM94_06085 [Blastocatellia bacterium]|nr:hypothetical protein [Blastocatellia bacterium]